MSEAFTYVGVTMELGPTVVQAGTPVTVFVTIPPDDCSYVLFNYVQVEHRPPVVYLRVDYSDGCLPNAGSVIPVTLTLPPGVHQIEVQECLDGPYVEDGGWVTRDEACETQEAQTLQVIGSAHPVPTLSASAGLLMAVVLISCALWRGRLR